MVNSKKIFQKQLFAAWDKWHAAYSSLSEEELQVPKAVGAWAIRDMIAHVSWSVVETNGMLEGQALVGSELWRLPEEKRNAAVYELNKDKPLANVLDEAKAAQLKLDVLVETISEIDLLHADWFADLPGEWPPWRVIQVNVVDHYLHHTGDITSPSN
jgi:uncharacterized damage-inducible protein DinB